MTLRASTGSGHWWGGQIVVAACRSMPVKLQQKLIQVFLLRDVGREGMEVPTDSHLHVLCRNWLQISEPLP
jgi:hypothetical protein